jgi:hypothetical protein
MPRVEFEPTIPEFERAKIVHVLDYAATMNGKVTYKIVYNMHLQGTQLLTNDMYY